MAIRATCPNPACRKILTVGDQFAGRTGKCPACGTIVKVPASAPPKDGPATSSGGPPPRSRPAAATQVIRPLEPEADWEVIDDEPPAPPPPQRPRSAAGVPVAPPAAAPNEPDIVSPDEVEIVESSLPGPPPLPARRSDERDPPPRRRIDDEVDDDDAPQRGRSFREKDQDDDEWKPKWPLVRVGLLVTFIGTSVLIGGLGFSAIAALVVLISFAGNSMDGLEVANVLYKTGVMISFLALIPVVIGYVFGIFTQTRYGALGLAIAAIALGVVNLVLDITFNVVPTFDNRAYLQLTGSVGEMILRLLVNLSFASQLIVYVLFLRAIYFTARDSERAAGCVPACYFFGVAGGIDLMIFIMMLIARKAVSDAWFYIVMICILARYGVLIGGLAWQLRIMWQLRKTIRLRLMRRPVGA